MFVIVMEMISRKLRAGLPQELLYADDLILMAESEESLQRCKANGKIQAGCSRSKLCERCKWKSVGRK